MRGDHFSEDSDQYARYRPRYPDALFEWLASLPAGRERAWDCATGSGQAAVALAPYFGRVVATDLSEAQLAAAQALENVEYRVATAEDSGLDGGSVDLVTVAQAIHWFDFDAFYAEVRRVAKPGAVVAAWTYPLMSVSEEVDAVLRHFYVDVVGVFWPVERAHVDNRYETIPFPFKPIDAPAFEMEVEWDFEHLIGYLGTWSATKRYQKARGADAVPLVEEELRRAWGDRSCLRRVHWPLLLKVGEVHGR